MHDMIGSSIYMRHVISGVIVHGDGNPSTLYGISYRGRSITRMDWNVCTSEVIALNKDDEYIKRKCTR